MNDEPNGVFLPDMTEDEYEEYYKNEVKGWGKVYKKINEIIKNDRSTE